MNLRQRRISGVIALLLVFSITQVYVGVSFAGAQEQQRPRFAASAGAVPLPQEATGSVTTQGNKPITVNGAAAISGATVLSGASIETPAGVSGTVSLGALGSLSIDPNTKLTLEFRSGSVRVMLLQGCVTLRTKKGTSGQIETPQGVVGKTDADSDGTAKTCAPGGVASPVPAAGAGGGLFGIGVGETISLLTLAGTFVLVPILRGSNPSPDSP